MIKQNWNISDNEKNRIISLHEDYTKNHYLITEQNESRIESITVPLDMNWGMGKYRVTTTQQAEVQKKLNQIQNFIFKHINSDISIQIESGESRVTNFDNEIGGNRELPQGELAKLRANSVIEILKAYFQRLVNGGSVQKMPTFPEPIIKIGDTPYTKGSNDLKDPNKLQKYRSEQFVRAIISLQKNYDCIVGLEITIGYYPGQNSQDHACDEAIFELKMNGISIGEINLNNSTLDTRLEQMDAKYERDLAYHKKRVESLNNAYTKFVNSGSAKEKNRDKYIQDNVGKEPTKPEIPELFNIKAQKLGYETTDKFIQDLKTINDAFKSYGRKSDGKSGGSRSQTFIIDGPKAKSIIDNAPASKIVLTLTPLVTKDGKYKIFYNSGSHSDTPWVTIKSKKSEQPLFNGEPNINMKRGETKETVLLQTDLCGNPLKNN